MIGEGEQLEHEPSRARGRCERLEAAGQGPGLGAWFVAFFGLTLLSGLLEPTLAQQQTEIPHLVRIAFVVLNVIGNLADRLSAGGSAAVGGKCSVLGRRRQP